jgi:pyruvate kinase
VDCPLEDVPVLQKQVIELAGRNAKPVIVATQMLDTAPQPTRAEAKRRDQRGLDGADAVMLSGETSVGAHPVAAVSTMDRIVESTEAHGPSRMAAIDWQPRTQGGVIAKAAAEAADRLDASYLVGFTISGDSARRLAGYGSHVPMLAFTPLESLRPSSPWRGASRRS